jgi:hypothetical protein
MLTESTTEFTWAAANTAASECSLAVVTRIILSFVLSGESFSIMQWTEFFFDAG